MSCWWKITRINRLVCAVRETLAAKIITLYNQGEQKSITSSESESARRVWLGKTGKSYFGKKVELCKSEHGKKYQKRSEKKVLLPSERLWCPDRTPPVVYSQCNHHHVETHTRKTKARLTVWYLLLEDLCAIGRSWNKAETNLLEIISFQCTIWRKRN